MQHSGVVKDTRSVLIAGVFASPFSPTVIGLQVRSQLNDSEVTESDRGALVMIWIGYHSYFLISTNLHQSTSRRAWDMILPRTSSSDPTHHSRSHINTLHTTSTHPVLLRGYYNTLRNIHCPDNVFSVSCFVFPSDLQ